jgi:CBS domain-containing protein
MPCISTVTTRTVVVVKPDETLQRAAELMCRLDVGALPVHDGQGLVGMVTDRDITVRGTAHNLRPDEARVMAVMTPQTVSCRDDESIESVMKRMGDAQVRRMPVLDARGEIVGIVSLGDLALRQPAEVDATLRGISQPGEPETVLG